MSNLKKYNVITKDYEIVEYERTFSVEAFSLSEAKKKVFIESEIQYSDYSRVSECDLTIEECEKFVNGDIEVRELISIKLDDSEEKAKQKKINRINELLDEAKRLKDEL